MNRTISKIVELTEFQKVDQLTTPLYQLEVEGHTFEITVLQNKEAATVSGSVAARFIRPDGTTVSFTGSASGNVATITLPQACYLYNGRFGLVVFVSGSGTTMALYACTGSVYKSTTDAVIDPDQNIPTLEDLLAEIEACENATAAANAAAADAASAALSGVRTDTNAQGLSDTQKANARTNIDAAGTVETIDLAESMFETPYTTTYDVISGGIDGSGANKNYAYLARTQYFDVNVNNGYLIVFSNSNFKLVNAFLYGSSVQSSVTRGVAVNHNTCFFFANAGENKCRISFARVDDATNEITSTEFEQIKASISIFVSSEVRTDTNAQGLSSTQKANARTNIDAASTSDITQLSGDITQLSTDASKLSDEIDMLADTVGESVAWEVGTQGAGQDYASGSTISNQYRDTTKYIDISAYKYLRYAAVCSVASTTLTGTAFFSGKTVGSYIDGVQGYANASAATYRDQWAAVPQGANFARFTLISGNTTGFFIEGFASIPAQIQEIISDQADLQDAITETNGNVTDVENSILDTNRVVNILAQLSNNAEMDPALFGNSTHPTGWRGGKWNDSGSAEADDTAICLTGRIGIPGGNNQRTGAKGVYVTSTFGTIEMKRYRSGSLIETITGSGIAYCGGSDGDMISVSITDLTSPSTDYIDNNDIANIHIYVMFADQVKAENVGTEYFYVQINKTWADGSADSLDAVNVDCVLKLPKNYSPGGNPVRLIFMHHGNSGTVNVTNGTWYSEVASWSNMVNAYLNAGYAVYDVNGCGPVSDTNASHDYGTFGALQAAYKAYVYITNKYNIQKRIFVHGSSMGGATAYAFAKAYPGIIDAMGLFSPALLPRSAGMSSVYDYIAVNYGYTDQAAMVADGYTHLFAAAPCIQYYQAGERVVKPFTYDWVNEHTTDGIDLWCADFKCPVKIWCGTADTSVDPKYGDELAKAIVNAGGFAIFRSVSGAGHNAGIGSNSTVNAEAVLWFNRFN